MGRASPRPPLDPIALPLQGSARIGHDALQAARASSLRRDAMTVNVEAIPYKADPRPLHGAGDASNDRHKLAATRRLRAAGSRRPRNDHCSFTSPSRSSDRNLEGLSASTPRQQSGSRACRAWRYATRVHLRCRARRRAEPEPGGRAFAQHCAAAPTAHPQGDRPGGPAVAAAAGRPRSSTGCQSPCGSVKQPFIRRAQIPVESKY